MSERLIQEFIDNQEDEGEWVKGQPEDKKHTLPRRLICPTCHSETIALLPQYNGCANCYGLTAETDCTE